MDTKAMFQCHVLIALCSFQVTPFAAATQQKRIRRYAVLLFLKLRQAMDSSLQSRLTIEYNRQGSEYTTQFSKDLMQQL